MARGALEAMLTVAGQQEFAAAMQGAMGAVRELAAVTDAASAQMEAAGLRMDAAFGAQRVAQMRAVNGELGTMRGHLRGIVSMLGGGGLLTAFGIFEGVRNAVKVQTNAMQWVSEASVPQSNVAALQRLAGQQAGLGISQIDAGAIIRQVQSAYSGKASNALIQSYFTNSSNLAAISGNRVSALDAATLLIPLLQADKSLKSDPTRAAGIINAMVGSGNMQTQDALAILRTPAVGALSGLGISAQDLAPFFAFGADTRSGQQAAPFARLLTTSFLNLARGGANKAGKADVNAAFGSQAGVIKMLQGPNGGVAAITSLRNYLVRKYGSLSSPGAIQEELDIFGGIRGGATPLSIYGNYDLFQQKNQQFTDLNDPAYYSNASRLAQLNPAQRGQVVRAEFSNMLSNLGAAALPLLLKVLPGLTEMFKVMGNPNVLHFIELMLALRGASMLAGGAGALWAAPLTGAALAKFNPYAAFRGAVAGRVAARAGTSALVTGLEAGAGGAVADAVGVATIGGILTAAAPVIAVAATAAALTIGGAYLYGAILHKLGWDKGNKIDITAAHQATAAGFRYSTPYMGNRRGAGSVARSQVPGAAYAMLPDMQTQQEAAAGKVSDDSVLAWAQSVGIFPQSEKGTMAMLLPRASDVTNEIRQKYAKAHNETYQGGNVYAPITIVQQPGESNADLAKRVASELKKTGARS